MAIEHLDRDKAFALLAEMTATRNLLACGIYTLRSAPFIDTTRDPIMTMLSIGLEKLYKVTLGLIALDRDHVWPSQAQMKARSHDLAKMHQEVMDAMWASSEGRSYPRTVLEEARDDVVLIPLIEALSVYGSKGRFYNLDLLGEAAQPVGPIAMWQEVEDAAFTDPEVLAARRRAFAPAYDNAAYDELTRLAHGRIAAAIERMWLALATCGSHGLLGESGKAFGSEIHPNFVGRQR